MYARSISGEHAEQSAHEAFEIAWHFLSHADDVGDPAVAQAFIAAQIMRLLERGERHKIRLANLAISAFRTTRPTDRGAALNVVCIG